MPAISDAFPADNKPRAYNARAMSCSSSRRASSCDSPMMTATDSGISSRMGTPQSTHGSNSVQAFFNGAERCNARRKTNVRTPAAYDDLASMKPLNCGIVIFVNCPTRAYPSPWLLRKCFFNSGWKRYPAFSIASTKGFTVVTKRIFFARPRTPSVPKKVTPSRFAAVLPFRSSISSGNPVAFARAIASASPAPRCDDDGNATSGGRGRTVSHSASISACCKSRAWVHPVPLVTASWKTAGGTHICGQMDCSTARQ